MEYIIHKANSRGHADHGWLQSFHSFSFAEYYNPDRTNFGLLRVLNDDAVEGGKGFGTHPHQNMEIISIPLEGELEHDDSTGTRRVIQTGDVQVMSAGTGIYHSEYNKSAEDPVRFLQIWIFPKYKDIAPRYDQKTFNYARTPNTLHTVVAPMDSREDVIKINQDAYLTLGRLEAGAKTTYAMHKQGNGVYAFILEGSLAINKQRLSRRDAIGVWDSASIELEASEESDVLLIEVPMKFDAK